MYRISIENEEIESMPVGCFPGEIHVIEKTGWDFLRAVEYLARQKVIGFDTETRPSFSPRQRNGGVALLQLSGPGKAFLFRVQKLGMHKLLCRILSSKRIIKVGAAVADDVRGLQRYAKFTAAGFVDLQKIGCEYGIRDKSVKKMAAIILGVKISKSQQLSNWEAVQLTEPQKKYAATDAWVCREMYLSLMASEKHPLSEEEKLPPQQLQQMKEAAERRAQKAEANRKAEEERRIQAARARQRKAQARAKAAEEQKRAASAKKNSDAAAKEALQGDAQGASDIAPQKSKNSRRRYNHHRRRKPSAAGEKRSEQNGTGNTEKE